MYRVRAVTLPLLLASACHGSCGKTEQHATPLPAPAVQGGSATTLLGGERGLDHVGVAVKDLAAATHTYHDVLGFNRPSEGRLPNGIRNVNYYFEDSTYLETMTYWDSAKAPWLASFSEKHEGALFAVLSAFSPDKATAFLGGRGIHVGAPYSGTIQTDKDVSPPEEKWKTFFLPNGLLPGDPLYFISYPRPSREDFLLQLEDPKVRRQFHHKNTVLGLRAVWIAVPDLDAAVKGYESIGLPRKQTFHDPLLDASGQVFEAGVGEVWLLAPKGPEGGVASFLRDRGGPGIIGITLAAGSVKLGAEWMDAHLPAAVTRYQGLRGDSFRLAPDATHGVWMEFSER